MKVFVSWSGSASRLVAEALHWWIPKVLQGVVPFISAKDIDKGSNWTVELARQLEEAQFGIICVTQENRNSPWLNYETGAITGSVESRVCPVLFELAKTEVDPPLAQLQLTSLDLEDIFLMMRSMNAVAGTNLSEHDLRDAVEIWWPKLEERLAVVPQGMTGVPASTPPEPEQPKVSDRELLEELLDLVRNLRRDVSPTRRQDGDPRRDEAGSTHLPRMSNYMTRLSREGLKIQEATSTSRLVIFTVTHVPEPLPGQAHNILSEIAREMKRQVIVEGTDGTEIEFDAHGYSLTPPF